MHLHAGLQVQGTKSRLREIGEISNYKKPNLRGVERAEVAAAQRIMTLASFIFAVGSNALVLN
jgi:hypothetical protein